MPLPKHLSIADNGGVEKNQQATPLLWSDNTIAMKTVSTPGLSWILIYCCNHCKTWINRFREETKSVPFKRCTTAYWCAVKCLQVCRINQKSISHDITMNGLPSHVTSDTTEFPVSQPRSPAYEICAMRLKFSALNQYWEHFCRHYAIVLMIIGSTRQTMLLANRKIPTLKQAKQWINSSWQGKFNKTDKAH